MCVCVCVCVRGGAGAHTNMYAFVCFFSVWQMHNIIFSGLPIIFCGILDFAIDADTTLKNPSLYSASLKGEVRC